MSQLLSLILLVLTGVLVGGAHVLAQEDTTPPVLLDFTLAPTEFDTGVGPVEIEWCFTASDDLSGLLDVLVDNVNSDFSLNGPFLGRAVYPQVTLEDTDCVMAVFPQVTPYDTYYLGVILNDNVGNRREYGHPLYRSVRPIENLCDLGPCEIVNRVPEPSAALLMIAALMAVAALHRRKPSRSREAR